MKNPFYFSSGTKQSDRMPKGLQEDFVSVDEKSMSEFLNFIQDFSGILKFWNLQNTPDLEANWQKFFENDLSFLLSNIERSDLSLILKKFRSLNQQYKKAFLNSAKEQVLVDLFKLSLDLADHLHDWYQKIYNKSLIDKSYTQFEKTTLGLYKANIWYGIAHVRQCYKKMLYFFSQNPNHIANENLQVWAYKMQNQFDLILGRDFLISEQSNLTSSNLEFSFNSYLNFFDFLSELFESFHRTAYVFKQEAEKYLSQSLEQNNHLPQVALFFALKEMLEPSKQLLNTFTEKHLDFYYRKVLLQKPTPPESDTVAVQFHLNPRHEKSFHSKGSTLLTNVGEDGKEISYKIEKDLRISKAKPIVFKTIYNGNNRFGHVFLAAPIANSGDGKGGPFLAHPPSWPTFGVSERELENRFPLSNSGRLGFAFSSSDLWLSDGDRTISLFFELGQDQLDALKNKLKKSNPSLSLSLFLENSFDLIFTGPKGWVKPHQVSVQTSFQVPTKHQEAVESQGSQAEEKKKAEKFRTAQGILFKINISNEQAACTGYKSNIHGPGYTESCPILQFTLKQHLKQERGRNSIHPYLLLKNLSIFNTYLEIDTQDSKEFVAQNDFSILKAKHPFPPFGNKPVLGSNFYLGNSEVFNRKLKALTLKISWYNLPLFPLGFYNYFNSYNLFNPQKPFYNSVFKWSPALLINKTWVPLKLKKVAKKSSPQGNSGEDKNQEQDTDSTTAEHLDKMSEEELKNLVFRHLLSYKALEKIEEQIAKEKGEQKETNPDEDKTSSVCMFEWHPLFEFFAPIQENDPDGPTPKKSNTNRIKDHLNDMKKRGIVHNWLRKLISFSSDKHSIEDKAQDILDALYTEVGKSENLSKSSLPQLASALNKPSEKDHPVLKELHKIYDSVAKRFGIGSFKENSSGKSEASENESSNKENIVFPYEFPRIPLDSYGKLKAESILSFDMAEIAHEPGEESGPFSSKSTYNERSESGFLRFCLKSPDYAFGSELYPRVLSKVANANIITISGKTDISTSYTEQDSQTPSETSSDSSTDQDSDKKERRGGLWKLFNGITSLLSIVNQSLEQ